MTKKPNLNMENGTGGSSNSPGRKNGTQIWKTIHDEAKRYLAGTIQGN